MELPEKVRCNAALMSETGCAWLADLPLLIAELERRWAITVGAPVRSGSEAFVAEARTSEGLDVIVKIVIPGIDPARQELRILRTAQGVGYAQLIRSDETNNVLLLEKLGPQLHEFRLPEDRQIQIICATLREAWMPPPEGLPWPTGADKAVEVFSHHRVALEFVWKAMFRMRDRAGAIVCREAAASVRSCTVGARAWRCP